MDITNIIQLSKKNKLEVNILFFSVLLLPVSLFVGPLITEILVFLICFSFIYNSILEKKKISFNNFEIMLISFFCLIVISSLLSDYKLISLKSSFLSIRFIILIYAIIFIIKKLDYFFKYFFIICLSSLLLNIFAGAAQFFYNDGFSISLKGPSKFIISGFFGDEKKLGSFLCRLTPLVMGCYLLVSKKEVEEKIKNIMIFFIFLFSLVLLTQERLALIYCTFTFLVFIFYAAKVNKKIIIIFSLLIALIPLLSYIFNINNFKENTTHTYNQIFPKGKLVYFSVQHQTFATTSIELFKSKPILGIGPNNFRKKCNEVSVDFITEEYGFDASGIQNCSTHPHNVLFQLLAEIGLIGIFYYIIFNIFLFIETFKFLFKKNYNQISFFFLLPVIYYLNPFFPSGNFFNNWYMCFGILGLPFYLYLAKIKNSV